MIHKVLKLVTSHNHVLFNNHLQNNTELWPPQTQILEDFWSPAFKNSTFHKTYFSTFICKGQNTANIIPKPQFPNVTNQCIYVTL